MCKGVCIPKTSKQLNRLSPNFLWQLKLSQYPQEGLWTVKVEKFVSNYYVKEGVQ